MVKSTDSRIVQKHWITVTVPHIRLLACSPTKSKNSRFLYYVLMFHVFDSFSGAIFFILCYLIFDMLKFHIAITSSIMVKGSFVVFSASRWWNTRKIGQTVPLKKDISLSSIFLGQEYEYISVKIAMRYKLAWI